MLVAFSVAPSGDGPKGHDNADGSVHDAVAAAVRVVRDSGLPNRTDAMFTTVEGEWDEVMDVVKRATEAVGEYGSRVALVLKADIRPDHHGELTGKLDRLEAALAAQREAIGRQAAELAGMERTLADRHTDALATPEDAPHAADLEQPNG